MIRPSARSFLRVGSPSPAAEAKQPLNPWRVIVARVRVPWVVHNVPCRGRCALTVNRQRGTNENPFQSAVLVFRHRGWADGILRGFRLVLAEPAAAGERAFCRGGNRLEDHHRRGYLRNHAAHLERWRHLDSQSLPQHLQLSFSRGLVRRRRYGLGGGPKQYRTANDPAYHRRWGHLGDPVAGWSGLPSHCDLLRRCEDGERGGGRGTHS